MQCTAITRKIKTFKGEKIEDIDELVKMAGLHKVDGDVVEPFALWNNWWRNQA